MLLAYIDCFAGLSAESLLDALVSAGLPRSQASTVFVDLHNIQETDASLLAAFHREVGASTLPALVKQVTQAVLVRLQEAEAAVYTSAMRSIFQVTGWHEWSVKELGALVNVVYGLSLLGIDRLECSPLQVGGGAIEAGDADERKLVPVLSPVTAELLRASSIPVYGSDQTREFVTPVGVALVATLSSQFGPLPAMKIRSIGYGTETAHRDGLHSTFSEGGAGLVARETRIFVGEVVSLERAPVSAAMEAVRRDRFVPARPKIDIMGEAPAVPVETLPEVGHYVYTAPQAADPVQPYVDAMGEWVAISIRGQQQSGRQRL